MPVLLIIRDFDVIAVAIRRHYTSYVIRQREMQEEKPRPPRQRVEARGRRALQDGDEKGAAVPRPYKGKMETSRPGRDECRRRYTS